MGPGEGTASPSWQVKADMARDFLESDIESLQASGIYVRAVDFDDLTLVDGTNPYTASEGTLDLLGDAMLQRTGETGWTPVRMISREEYVALSDKDTAGAPTLYYPHRAATFSIYLWPVPDSSNLGIIRFQRHRLLATATEGGATLDLERHWSEWAVWSLAHKLACASSLPTERCGYLDARAQRHFQRAQMYSRQRTPGQVVLGHRSGVR